MVKSHSILTVHSKDKKESHKEMLKCIPEVADTGSISNCYFEAIVYSEMKQIMNYANVFMGQDIFRGREK